MIPIQIHLRSEQTVPEILLKDRSGVRSRFHFLHDLLDQTVLPFVREPDKPLTYAGNGLNTADAVHIIDNHAVF